MDKRNYGMLPSHMSTDEMRQRGDLESSSERFEVVDPTGKGVGIYFKVSNDEGYDLGYKMGQFYCSGK